MRLPELNPGDSWITVGKICRILRIQISGVPETNCMLRLHLLLGLSYSPLHIHVFKIMTPGPSLLIQARFS